MVNENTRLMARLHPDLNNRGLNIYNPYFSAAGVDADYHLFRTPDIAKSFSALKVLGLAGAITAGSFETDEHVASLVDDLSPLAERLGKVAMVANVDGQLVGHHQAAYGLYDALTRLCGPAGDLELSIIGSGTVVRALFILFEIERTVPKSVSLFCRSPERAAALTSEFSFAKHAGSLDSLDSAEEGSVLINATPIGSPWNRGDTYVFADDVVRRFAAVVDVTFVPLETQLTEAAKRLGSAVSHGSDMFLGQAAYVLREVLQHEMQREVFRPIMLDDFRNSWS